MADGTTTESGRTQEAPMISLIIWMVAGLVVDLMQIAVSGVSASVPIIGWIFGYIVSVCLAVIFLGIFLWWLSKKGISHWMFLGIGFVLELVPVVNLFFWIGLSLAFVIVAELAKQAADIAAEAAKGKLKRAVTTLVKKGAKLAAEALAPEAAPAIEAASKAVSAASSAKKAATNKPQF